MKRVWRKPRTTDVQWSLFSLKSKLLGLGRQIGQINSEAFAVFSVELSAPVLVLWVPCPCFLPLFNHYFKKKLNFYIHIPNIYLGLEFEFGLRVSVVRAFAKVTVYKSSDKVSVVVQCTTFTFKTAHNCMTVMSESEIHFFSDRIYIIFDWLKLVVITNPIIT